MNHPKLKGMLDKKTLHIEQIMDKNRNNQFDQNRFRDSVRFSNRT